METEGKIIGSFNSVTTLAASAVDSVWQTLILERGEHLENPGNDLDYLAISEQGVFNPNEQWIDGGVVFDLESKHNVSGKSKFYNSMLFRHWESDSLPVHYEGGRTAAGAISNKELAPDYLAAEQMYGVCGLHTKALTEPYRSGESTHKPIANLLDIGELRKRRRAVGLHPASLPLAVNLDLWLVGERQLRDSYPDTYGVKIYDENVPFSRAPNYPNIEVITKCIALKSVIDMSGYVTHVQGEYNRNAQRFSAKTTIHSFGVVQSAAHLSASAGENFKSRLTQSSNQLRRNFRNLNCSAGMGMHVFRKRKSSYHKTSMSDDFYHTGGVVGTPLGYIQRFGKNVGPIQSSSVNIPLWLAKLITARSIDFYSTLEDISSLSSRVTLIDGNVHLDCQRSTWTNQKMLVSELKIALGSADLVVLSRHFDRSIPSHQRGTALFGNDPNSSVVNSYYQSHDHSNLSNV